jgi:hypothetical protein
MGWSDPTFGCLRLANTPWGRSSPANRETLCLRSVLPASSQDKKEKRRKHMSIINKPPQHVKREYELEEPVALVVEKYATFIDSTPDHVVNSALKMLLWKDKHFMNWRKQQQQAARKDTPATATQKAPARA